MTARVFIVEPTKVDVRGATRYGNIVYMYTDDDRRSSVFAPEFAEEALERLKVLGFDPDHDYVCVAGNVAALTQFLCAVTAEFGGLNALIFNSSTRQYVTRPLGRRHHDAHIGTAPLHASA